jgi:hypothetical protein
MGVLTKYLLDKPVSPMLKLIRNQWPTWTRICKLKIELYLRIFWGMILMKLSEESNLRSSELYNISTQIVLETLVATRFLNFRYVSERSSYNASVKKREQNLRNIICFSAGILWCWICLLLTKLFLFRHQGESVFYVYEEKRIIACLAAKSCFCSV